MHTVKNVRTKSVDYEYIQSQSLRNIFLINPSIDASLLKFSTHRLVAMKKKWKQKEPEGIFTGKMAPIFLPLGFCFFSVGVHAYVFSFWEFEHINAFQLIKMKSNTFDQSMQGGNIKGM